MQKQQCGEVRYISCRCTTYLKGERWGDLLKVPGLTRTGPDWSLHVEEAGEGGGGISWKLFACSLNGVWIGEAVALKEDGAAVLTAAAADGSNGGIPEAAIACGHMSRC